MESDDRNRCSYHLGPQRCAYIARFFPNCTEQSRDAQLERGVCLAHFEIGVDLVKGREGIDRGNRSVPLDFDYATLHLIELSLTDYLGGWDDWAAYYGGRDRSGKGAADA